MKILFLLLSILPLLHARPEISEQLVPKTLDNSALSKITKVSEICSNYLIQSGKSYQLLKEMFDLPDAFDKYKTTTVIVCPENYVQIESFCIFVDRSLHMHWDKAREFCQRSGGDLFVFRDANEYAAVQLHIKKICNGKVDNNFWLGGSDILHEGDWVWIDGTKMPRGSPYWGTLGWTSEPNGGLGENCAIFYSKDSFYLHDLSCTAGAAWKTAPVCQWSPE